MDIRWQGSVVVFEDQDDALASIATSLKNVFQDFGGKVEVLFSRFVDQSPSADGQSNKLLDKKTLLSADAVIVDLKMQPGFMGAHPGGIRQIDCDICRTNYSGIHVLLKAKEWGCLSRALINSAYLSGISADPIFELLKDLVQDGVGVFEKDNFSDLGDKLYSALELRRVGYSTDAATRDKLYLVARRVLSEKMEPVLILGKTGTGKEQAARYIHTIGQRLLVKTKGQERAIPLAVVNCGGLTITMARDELFGHVKGAYTDAKYHTIGQVLTAIGCVSGMRTGDQSYSRWFLEKNSTRFEPTSDSAAHDKDGNPLDLRVREDAPFGTLFLDEFGELDPSVQASLLRFLESGEIRPLGYEGTISLKDKRDRLHVRFVGATNNEEVRQVLAITPDENTAADESGPGKATRLDEMEEASSVRADLIYRLGQWIVDLPDLQPHEVDLLIELEKMYRPDLESVTWKAEAKRELAARIEAGEFPGQRRQLRTVIMRAMAYAKELPALGIASSFQRGSVVTKEILDEAVRPISIKDRGANAERVSALQSAICSWLVAENIWAGCQIGFRWPDARKSLDKGVLCEAYLNSMLFHDPSQAPYQLEELDQAWGATAKQAENNTIRNHLKDSLARVVRDKFSDLEIEDGGVTFGSVKEALRKQRKMIAISDYR
jgi:hypothetical protein